MAQIYAALTGDIVKSSKLSSEKLDEVREAIEQASGEVGEWERGLVAAKPDFFRGDSWQMVLAEPAYALRVAMYLRASLKARNKTWDSRIAIGIGRVEPLEKKQASLSSGPAMMASGKALDKMGAKYRLAIATEDGDTVEARWVELAIRLVDILVGHWTRGQAEAVKAALWPREQTHEEIARRMYPDADDEQIKDAKRRSVTKSLDGADWHGLEEALERFESADWP